jgi:CHAT domain-containing protein
LPGSAGGHIGAKELARLLELARSAPESTSFSSDLNEHFAACATCRELFQELSLLEGQIRKGLVVRPPSSECPSPAIWREIAAGLPPPEQTLAHIEHASRCDSCGPQLRQAVVEVAALNGVVSESERKQIAALESAHQKWQEKLAQRIAATPLTETRRLPIAWWRRWLTTPRLAFAGTALLVMAAVTAWFAVRRNQPSTADQLLARAYTQKRTLELRIAGAEYAPVRVSLGPAASFTNRPATLLEAEALIAHQIQSHVTDPSWLQAQARADLLEGKYDGAIETLRRALELSPHSSSVLTDLATAYFQRGLQEDRKEDFGVAYEYLSQALVVTPDDPVALFNRAIVAERQFLYHQAIDDWEHYLRVDPKSPWAEEVRSRANAVRDKLSTHARTTGELLSTGQIAARASDPNQTAALASAMDDRVDEYLDAALRTWLPLAFPEHGAKSDPQALRALFFLANLTLRQHDDHWLTDFLARSSARDFPRAANALARSVTANHNNEFRVGAEQADIALRLFRGATNTAGVLQTRFEQTLSDQFENRGGPCLRLATTALAEAEKYSDTWLQIQFLLQKAVCSNFAGKVGNDERLTTTALAQAQKNRYGALYLRAAFFAADDKFIIGDVSGGTALSDISLERYWEGSFAAVRGYSLYHPLAHNAEAAGRPYLQVAIWREIVELTDSDYERLLTRGAARNSYANAAAAAGMPHLAEEQYAEAARILAAAPEGENKRISLLDIEIRRAQVEIKEGLFDDAIARLTRIGGQVPMISDVTVSRTFYSTMGQLQLARHRESEAESAFLTMMRIAEQNLRSLTSESERTAWSIQVEPIYLGLAEAQLLQGREQESLDTFEQYLDAPPPVIPVSGMMQPHGDSSRVTGRLHLLANQTVLAYGVLPDGVAIWAYDDRGITAKWIGKSSPDIEELAGRFYTECADPNSEPSALHRDGQKLYALLIKPIEDRLDPTRVLVIESQGFLARLPFEALMDADGHPLIERSSIVHSSGSYAEARMHHEVVISHELPALIVGSEASLPNDGLFVIPNILGGTNAVANDFLDPRVFTGSDATLEAVRKSLPRAAVFNFEGHAVIDPTHAGLLLQSSNVQENTPRLLDADVVRSLDLHNLQLAVLAACDTDSGQQGSRDLDSVARAFQASGVPHVVASRWMVDALETNAFANSFYTAVLSGQSVSAATRLTAQQMLANPRTAHPYYWAAFAAYGRP